MACPRPACYRRPPGVADDRGPAAVGCILGGVRIFSLLFAFIALVILAQFLIYVTRGPVDPAIAGVIFFGFLACLAPALYLLKPFERPEQRREREEKERHREPPEDTSG